MRKIHLNDGDEVLITEAVGVWDAKKGEIVLTKLEYAEDTIYGSRVCLGDKEPFVQIDGTENDEIEAIEDQVIETLSCYGIGIPENIEDIVWAIFEEIREIGKGEGWTYDDVSAALKELSLQKLAESKI